ncbi:L7Ae/L30e/S12e/Gadd45 family ribosomal protein [Gemella cuniculi]|uniref:L7Ae/L30e/S12e/Gadd45 family ribosomal protein n=1 Tax=Gemella cuniculi TaxID=150240 RepID=UPI00040A981F|nr:ribosomal L7Ae/L30e/S12e/Gadd45 family protein [Gemella cuniculi]
MNKIYNLLGLMQRAGKLITGEDLIIKNLKNRKIKLLVITEDCGVNTKKKLVDKSNFYSVDYIIFSSIEDISVAIGRDNRVAVGITDDGFIKKFKQLLEEGGRR